MHGGTGSIFDANEIFRYIISQLLYESEDWGLTVE